MRLLIYDRGIICISPHGLQLVHQDKYKLVPRIITEGLILDLILQFNLQRFGGFTFLAGAVPYFVFF